MERNKRLYPIDEEQFNKPVVPIIEASYIGKGRPPEVTHYKAFCGILYILRTGVPWRDLPGDYGEWHTIYDRFNRGNARGLLEQSPCRAATGGGACVRRGDHRQHDDESPPARGRAKRGLKPLLFGSHGLIF